MAVYRQKFANYYPEQKKTYAPVGSVLPVFADEFFVTDSQDPHYSYEGYLYCDGSELRIREYPALFNIIGNEYGGSTRQETSTRNTPGFLAKSFITPVDGQNELFFAFYKDTGIMGVTPKPYPDGANIRFFSDTGLGPFPAGVIEPDVFYGLDGETQDIPPGLLTFVGTDYYYYKVVFPVGYEVDLSTVNTSDWLIDVSITGTVPRVSVGKGFAFTDYPFNIGTFNLPDYRDRKIVGFGPVDGSGTSTVENALVNFVGQTGGRWYISKDTLVDSGEFFSVGDVKTTGYTDTIADIRATASGYVDYTIGPLVDIPLSFPPEHGHRILSAEADEARIVQRGNSEVDNFAVTYITSRANVSLFEPAGGDPLGHSHGLLGTRLQNATAATYGNSSGIGDIDSVTPDNIPLYKISEAASFNITVMTHSGGVITVSSDGAHGLEAGNIVTIQGATPAEYNGNFEVKTEGLTLDQFTVDADNGTPASSPAGGFIVGKLANGFFAEETSTPQPRAYIVENSTKVGGKIDEFEIPGNLQTIQTDSLNTAGSDNISAPSGVTLFGMRGELTAPGGGGGSSTAGGGDGGEARLTMTVDGVSYTIIARGGDGGQAGNSGGSGGSGGTYQIPAALFNDPRFDWNVSNGESGDDSPAAGPYNSGSSTSGGGQSGTDGAGGSGSSSAREEVTNGNVGTYYSNGQYNVPSPGNNVTSRIYNIQMSGGGGGNGNPNANSGCGGGATGGSGNSGKLLSGTLSVNSGFISWIIGQAGQQGFNNKDGNTGTGSEAGPAYGGGGAATGGRGATGAWGNGATGGAGGGCTALYLGGNAVAGAGGGGGGGGSGGGFNGGGTTDGCYAGASATNESGGLINTTPIDFSDGANGTSGGCTAGGGGGGGAGAGIVNQNNGGSGGVAGVGHNGNGGGSGGARGRSAYRSDYWLSMSSSNGGAGAGQSGYVSISFSQTELFYDRPGGGGGSGSSLSFETNGVYPSCVIQLQSPGGNGEQGQIVVAYTGRGEGEVNEGDPSVPTGKYWLCDENGIPTGAGFTGDVWQSSNDDNIKQRDAGTGTGDSGGFTLTNVGAIDPKVQKYIEFTGLGENGVRSLEVGTFNLSNVERIRFTVKRGSGQNGGDDPEEDLMVYYQRQGSTNTQLLDQVMAATNNNPDWQDIDINLPPESQAREAGITLFLRQDRVAGGDNSIGPKDQYGLAGITLFYGEVTSNVFTATEGATIPGNVNGGAEVGSDIGINEVRRRVTAQDAALALSDGVFTMSSSTPVTTRAEVRPENDIPLITKYHRVKYLIKAI